MEEEGDQEEEEGGEEEEKDGSTDDGDDDDDDDGDGDDEGEKEPRPRKRAGGKTRKTSKASKRSKKTSNTPAKMSHHSKSSLLVLPEGGATFVRAHMVEKSWVNLRFNENAVGQYQKLYDEASQLALDVDSQNHTPDHLWETIMREHAKGMNNGLQPHQQLQPQQQKQCLRRMLNEKDYPVFPKGPNRG